VENDGSLISVMGATITGGDRPNRGRSRHGALAAPRGSLKKINEQMANARARRDSKSVLLGYLKWSRLGIESEALRPPLADTRQQLAQLSSQRQTAKARDFTFLIRPVVPDSRWPLRGDERARMKSPLIEQSELALANETRTAFRKPTATGVIRANI
jgi:hypothetical protein